MKVAREENASVDLSLRLPASDDGRLTVGDASLASCPGRPSVSHPYVTMPQLSIESGFPWSL
jgi:hypothetical protein